MGRSLASKFSNSLGLQPSSPHPHTSHPTHHRSRPLLALSRSLSLHSPLQHQPHQTISPHNMSNPALPSVPYRSHQASLFVHGAEYLFICPSIHPANLSHPSLHPNPK